MQLDAGPFVAALEYAAGAEALVLGKPSPDFFASAREEFSCPLDRVTMIGDDARSDVGAALAVGMRGILMQTGKYRPGDEALIDHADALVAANMSEAVDVILAAER